LAGRHANKDRVAGIGSPAMASPVRSFARSAADRRDPTRLCDSRRRPVSQKTRVTPCGSTTAGRAGDPAPGVQIPQPLPPRLFDALAAAAARVRSLPDLDRNGAIGGGSDPDRLMAGRAPCRQPAACRMIIAAIHRRAAPLRRCATPDENVTPARGPANRAKLGAGRPPRDRTTPWRLANPRRDWPALFQGITHCRDREPPPGGPASTDSRFFIHR